MGFLFAAGLAGLATIGWPLYLHFRKRRQQVQTVPSLRLFGYTRKRTRQFRMRELLLLLSRIALLAALFLLLGQPYWETERRLPLPGIAGEAEDDPILCVVLDDTLTAQHGVWPDSRLNQAREWLSRQIAALPPTAKIRFAPASSPQPTQLLHPKEALAFLEAVKIIPQAGNAAEAAHNLLTDLPASPVCLVAVAPRSAKLWAGLKPDSDFASPTPLHFFDTSQWQCDIVLRQVGPDPTVAAEGAYLATVTAAPDALQGRRFVLDDGTGAPPLATPVTVHGALRGQVKFKLPEHSPDGVMAFSLEAPRQHPWHSTYFDAGTRRAAAPAVLVLRPDTPAALVADKIISAVIQATRPQAPITHLRPADWQRQELPLATVVVVVGAGALSPGLTDWLIQRLRHGVQILCVPTADMPADQAPAAAPILPAWAAPRRVTQADVAPLRLASPSAAWPSGLDELLTAAEGEIALSQVIEPNFTDAAHAVLATRQGQSLLALRPLGAGSAVWALGFPLSLAENSPVFHPSFPLILESMLFASGAGAEGGGEAALVGSSMNLPEWFQQDTINGTLFYPDGRELELRCTTSNPVFLTLDEPGKYRLETTIGKAERAANYPRLPTDAVLFTRAEWAAKRPDTQTSWLGPDDLLAPADFVKLAGAHAGTALRRYDLSPVALALLVVFILLEGLFLLQVWLPRRDA